MIGTASRLLSRKQSGRRRSTVSLQPGRGTRNQSGMARVRSCPGAGTTLRTGLANLCSPAFMTLCTEVGKPKRERGIRRDVRIAALSHTFQACRLLGGRGQAASEPLVEPSLERAHFLISTADQHSRQTGAGSLVGSRAVQDDLLFFRHQVAVFLEVHGGYPERSRNLHC